MNFFDELIKASEDATLWRILADIASILEKSGFENTNANAFWFQFYKRVQNEIDLRLLNDYEK